jgi:hypothetical protein
VGAGAAFSDATRYAAFAAAGFLLVGLLACLCLPPARAGATGDAPPAAAEPAQV